MKWISRILFTYLVLGSYLSWGQSEYSRFDTYVAVCYLEAEEDLFALGLKVLKQEDGGNLAGRIFFKVLEANPSSCDASFLVGVSLTLQEEHAKALPYYYLADSLYTPSRAIFKQELAEASLRINNVGFARKTYQHMVIAHPDNINGYLGIALTATSIGDYDNGIQHLMLAEELIVNSKEISVSKSEDIRLLKGILYILKEEYVVGLEVLDTLSQEYRDSKDYYIYFIIATYELYKRTGIVNYKERFFKALEGIEKYETSVQPEFFTQYQL